jgi:hypothetical protein
MIRASQRPKADLIEPEYSVGIFLSHQVMFITKLLKHITICTMDFLLKGR